jgi:hypothetical protein
MANSSVKNLNIDGNVVISGSTTSIDVAQLTVDDNNITLNDIASPLDSNANGGGLTLKGTTDHTFNWLDATDSWTSSEHIDVATGKEYKINNTSVLNATTLGAGVVNSGLTDVGTLTSLQVDLLYLDGSQIGLKTTDEDLITLTNNTVTVAGTVAATQFTGGGAGITGLGTSNITVPASPGDFLYNNAGAWGGITPPITVALGGTAATTAAAARTNLGVTATGADTAYNFRANNLSDVASASTSATNLGLGTANSPNFGGVGTGSVTITATPTSGPAAAPTFSGVVFKNVPVASGSGHKWVTGIEQDGDLAFSHFAINDAGANVGSAVGYLTLDSTNTRVIVGNTGGTAVNVVMSGLGYPTADGTANQVLTTDGSAGLTFGTPVTTNITEGTNLYYTDARAIAALNWANLNNKTGASGPTAVGIGRDVNGLGANAVAIGDYAGETSQSQYAVALGEKAGGLQQGVEATALGRRAGSTQQKTRATAVGAWAGEVGQDNNTVAVGYQAGQTNQEDSAIAIGSEAGQTSQGELAIAIGTKAGETNQGDSSIVISATGVSFNPTTASALFIQPIRNVAGTTYLQYNNTTKEVTHIAATTSSIAEGTNLYYTNARADARADARIGAASITALSDVTITTPATNALLQYNGSAWIDAIPTTAHITEGANLYYTDARADARIVNAGSANWNTAYTATNAATNSDTNNTLVKRGSTGNISVSKITANSGIVLGNNTGTLTGTMRWTGTDFHGYNGSAWVSLTSAATALISGTVATFTTAQTVTGTSYADIPGYTTAITVTTSNIINVQVNVDLQGPASSNNYNIKLVRVVSGTPTDLYIDESGRSDGISDHFNATFADVHGQSNGTVITYKLMAKVDAGTLTVNPDTTNAQIFLQEMTTTPTTVTSVNGAAGTVVLTTSNIAEGTNLYYTTARWDTKMAAADTDDLSEGSTNLYHQDDLGSVA